MFECLLCLHIFSKPHLLFKRQFLRKTQSKLYSFGILWKIFALITFEIFNYYACNWFNQKVLPPLMKAITWCCILGSYKIVALQECITSSFFQFRWLQFCQKELDELRLLSEFLFYYRIIFSRLHLLGLLKQFPHTVWFLSMMKRIYFFHTATFQMADSPNLSVPFCIKREDTLSVKITANILQSLIGIL